MSKSFVRAMLLSAASFSVLTIAAAFFTCETRAEPIPTDKKAPTQEMWEKRYVAHRLRAVRLYEKTTQDPAKLRKSAAAFIEKVITQDVDGWPEPGVKEKLAKQGRKLLENGSTDPLVLDALVYTLGLDGNNNLEETQKLIVDAVKRSVSMPYPAEMQFRLLDHGRAIMEYRNHLDDMEPYAELYVKTTVAMLSEAVNRPQDRRIIWGLLLPFMTDTNEMFLPFQKQLYEAASKKLWKIDPWTLNMIGGAYHIREGWSKRGVGFASTVKKENWKPFLENVKLAGEYFSRAWEIDPKIPQAPCAMIQVAMCGCCEDSIRVWFDRAVAAQVDYQEAYDAYLWALRPRWQGSHSEMYKFGRECAATKRFDTMIPFNLINAIRDIDSDRGYNGEAWRRKGVYKNALAVFDGLDKEFAAGDDPLHKRRQEIFQAARGCAAIQANKFSDACKAFDSLTNVDDFAGVCASFGVDFATNAPKFFAMNGPSKESVREFQRLLEEYSKQYADEQKKKDQKEIEPFDARRAMSMTSEQRKTILRLLDEGEAKDPNVHAKRFFNYWKTVFRWHEQYMKGDWVDLKFDADWMGWRKMTGRWTFENEKSVIGESVTMHGGFILSNAAQFDGSPFELELDVEFIEADHNTHCISGAGLKSKGIGGAFFCLCDNCKAMEVYQEGVHQGCGGPASPEKVHHLRIVAKKGDFEYRDNDRTFAKPRATALQADGVFWIGTAPWHAVTGRVRFSNVRIRKSPEKGK